MKKRLLFMTLGLVALILIMAGCGGGSTPATSSAILDYSHSGTQGLSFGINDGDQVRRFQTFIADNHPTLTGIDVKIRKNESGTYNDVTVSLYETDSNHLPSNLLATTTLDTSSLGTAFTEMNVPIVYHGLAAGQTYAIVLGQKNLADVSNSGYEWCISSVSADIFFGKFNGSAWTNESHMGDGWLKVHVDNSGGSNPGVVYMSGTLDNSSCYWVGTDRTDLTGRCDANDIMVDGGSVFIAGRHWSDGKFLACYWTGTTCTDLSTDYEGQANAITVVNGVVYTCGYYNNGTSWIPCYWVGTTRHDLPGTGSTQAMDIAVVNGTVYTAGYYKSGNTFHPCYWTDATRNDLTGSATTMAWAQAIVLSNETVFTAGEVDSHPCYWTGAVQTSLPTNGTYGSSQAISISNGNIVTGGYSDNGSVWIACVWSGTNRTDLGDGAHNSMVNAITVYQGQTYAAGFYQNDSYDYVPCYWRGTTRTDLPTPGSYPQVTGIVVK